MQRSRALFREFGLTLALLLAAVLIYWRTTVPALKKNRVLDAKHLELLDEQERLAREIRRLEALERAGGDPETIERMEREQFGRRGLAHEEQPIDPTPPFESRNSRVPEER